MALMKKKAASSGEKKPLFSYAGGNTHLLIWFLDPKSGGSEANEGDSEEKLGPFCGPMAGYLPSGARTIAL